MDRLRLFVWRPHTTVILSVGLALILISLVASFITANFKATTELRLGSGIYSLWVANTESERIQGLSGVKALDPNGGLLMDFGFDGQHGIWMKDMNFPLDLVWLDKDKKVIYVVMNAQVEEPARTIYQPKDNARYVIELPAGSAKKAGIKTGNVAKFTIDV